MLGGIGGRRSRGRQRMRWLDDIIDLMDVSLSEFRELVMDMDAWHAVIHVIAKSRTWLSNWSELNWCILMSFPANYVIYILLVFLLIDFSLIMDIFFLLYTSRIFFFLNLCIFLNQRIITLQYWDETKTNTCPSFKLYYGCPRLLMCSLYLWMLDFFLNFYKLFLSLFANAVNFLETIAYFEGLL